MGDIKRGDIFYIIDNYSEVGSEQRGGRPAIIVSNNKNNDFSSTVEVVYLTTSPKKDLPTHCTIRSSPLISTALCEQITAVSTDRIGDFYETISADEMMMVEKCMMISLGIDLPAPAKSTTPDPQPSKPKSKVNPETQRELIEARKEAEIYKTLYDSILTQILNRR